MQIAFHPSFPGFDPSTAYADLGLTFKSSADLGELAQIARDSDALVLIGPRYTRDLAETIARPGTFDRSALLTAPRSPISPSYEKGSHHRVIRSRSIDAEPSIYTGTSGARSSKPESGGR